MRKGGIAPPVSLLLLYKGDHVRKTLLGITLLAISNEGADAIYNGSLTSAILEEVNGAGGNWTREDLIDYNAEVNHLVFVCSSHFVGAEGADGLFSRT